MVQDLLVLDHEHKSEISFFGNCSVFYHVSYLYE